MGELESGGYRLALRDLKTWSQHSHATAPLNNWQRGLRRYEYTV
jgi:hypothetical protein